MSDVLAYHRHGFRGLLRFNYHYPDAELKEIAEHIRVLSRAVPVVHAVLNNNYQDQGQRNARTLAGFLR